MVWHNVESSEPVERFWPEYLGEPWPDYFGTQENTLAFFHEVGGYHPFAKDQIISQGLRRLLFFYPGAIKAASNADASKRKRSSFRL